MKVVFFVFDHSGDREPGNHIALGICVFKGLIKLHYEILKGSKGKRGKGEGEGELSEGECPCGGGPFVHV